MAEREAKDMATPVTMYETESGEDEVPKAEVHSAFASALAWHASPRGCLAVGKLSRD